MQAQLARMRQAGGLKGQQLAARMAPLLNEVQEMGAKTVNFGLGEDKTKAARRAAFLAGEQGKGQGQGQGQPFMAPASTMHEELARLRAENARLKLVNNKAKAARRETFSKT